MRMDKFTSKFQLALADAQSLAVGLDHQLIEPAPGDVLDQAVKDSIVMTHGGGSNRCLKRGETSEPN